MGVKKDLTGKRFGKLVVLAEVPKEERKNSKKVEWLCQCDCGKTTKVVTNYLNSGHTTSCGCRRKEAMSESMSLNLIGLKFGQLLVIEKTDKRASDGCIIWKCQCDCGNIAYVNTNSLKRGDIQSCGCIRSRGEKVVNNLLFEMGLNYQTQFWFKDLKDKKYLYFDFAILNEDNSLNCLIEYQGIQHFDANSIHGAWKNLPFEHDRMKREYCKLHNIKLLEIPYYDFDKLDIDYMKNKLSL